MPYGHTYRSMLSYSEDLDFFWKRNMSIVPCLLRSLILKKRVGFFGVSFPPAYSSKLLKETWLSLENRQRLTSQTYKDLVSSGDAGYIMAPPDVGVMGNPVLRRKWFQHFNLDRERMICHSLEKCVAYINGKPICVPCPNSYVFCCFCFLLSIVP